MFLFLTGFYIRLFIFDGLKFWKFLNDIPYVYNYIHITF